MKGENCPECDGRIEIQKQDVDILGKVLGRFDVEVCKDCGSVFLDEEQMRKV